MRSGEVIGGQPGGRGKNVITQAIGNKKNITPRITTHHLEKMGYDTILICSDGVSDRLANAEIHKTVKKYDNPQDVCDRIVKVINRTNSNHDNISVICIKFPNLFQYSDIHQSIDDSFVQALETRLVEATTAS